MLYKCLNIILWFTASFLIVLLASEFILAVKGANTVTSIACANVEKSELDFCNNVAGWGVSNDGRDSEDPEVIIRVWKNGARESRMNQDKKTGFRVAFLGCSYTFGTGVEAWDTMVWRLNDKYPDITFDNWGVSGWGPAQMYLRLQYLFSREKYDIIVYNAIYDHMFRSYTMRAVGEVNFNSSFVPVPYANWDVFGRFRIHSVSDLRWPMESDLVTVNFLKRSLYGYKTAEYEKFYTQHSVCSHHYFNNFALARKCHAELTNRMGDLCRAHNTDFLVCVLEDYPYEDDSFKIENVVTNNSSICCERINVDMPDEKAHIAENRVLNNPAFHPNKNVHKYWADEFAKWFDKKYPEYAK